MVIYQAEGPFKRLPFPHTFCACAVGVTAFTARPVWLKQPAAKQIRFFPGKKMDLNHHHWAMMC